MMSTFSCWMICIMTTASMVTAEMIDLSHDHGTNTIMSPDNPKYRVQNIFDGDIQPGVHAMFNKYSLGEHGGTHLDAPIHFHKGGKSLEKIPLEDTIADGVMIDCTKEVAQNTQYALTLGKLKQWEKENGNIPTGAAVVLNFNWSHKFNNSNSYFNTNNLDDTDTYKFPHIGREASDWLVDQRNVKILAIDTPSPDLLKSDFPVHVKFLQNNKLLVENLKDPSRLPARGFRFHATPAKFIAATGVQIRAFAITGESSNKGSKTEGMNCLLFGCTVFYVLSKLSPFV